MLGSKITQAEIIIFYYLTKVLSLRDEVQYLNKRLEILEHHPAELTKPNILQEKKLNATLDQEILNRFNHRRKVQKLVCDMRQEILNARKTLSFEELFNYHQKIFNLGISFENFITDTHEYKFFQTFIFFE